VDGAALDLPHLERLWLRGNPLFRGTFACGLSSTTIHVSELFTYLNSWIAPKGIDESVARLLTIARLPNIQKLDGSDVRRSPHAHRVHPLCMGILIQKITETSERIGFERREEGSGALLPIFR
jgi:hypothetical protein